MTGAYSVHSWRRASADVLHSVSSSPRYRPTPVGFPQSSRASTAIFMDDAPRRRRRRVRTRRAQASQLNVAARARPRSAAACARHRARAARAMAAAKPSTSSGAIGVAASPATSGSEPPDDTTTGTPHAIASSTGRPKPSSRDGSTSMCARANRSIRRACGDVTGQLDMAGEIRGRGFATARPRRSPARHRPAPGAELRAPAPEAAGRPPAGRRCSCADRACPGTGCARAARRAAGSRTAAAHAGAPGGHRWMRSAGTLSVRRTSAAV